MIESLGGLALVAMLSAGAVAMIHAAMEDTRSQHAGRHQATVVEATQRYVRERYADLVTATASAPAAVPLSTITSFLPVGFQPANVYGQTPCLRVMQPAPGRLHVLVVTEGGEPIPRKDLAYAAAHAGPGGGYVAQEDPAFAQGAFGSWRVDVASFGSGSCGAAAPGTPPNQLASAMFFDGPDTSATDFLYRGEVPGHPELNAMEMPLAMRGRAVAVENDTSDPLCTAADPLAQGRIAVSSDAVLLTCQSGRWRRQEAAFWRAPVADFASLPSSGNEIGDTRVTMDTRRAFTWGGSDWKALAVDQNGDLEVPRQLTLTSTVVRNTACSPNGAVSREANGLAVSCQSGRWQTLGVFEIDPAQSENGSMVVMRSNYMTYPGGTPFYAGPFVYDAPNDTVMATIERPIMPTREGLFVSNSTLDLAVGTISSPTDEATTSLIAQVIDRDTGNVIAVNQARQARMVYDRAILAVTISKALPRNVNGYTFQMLVRWSRRQYSYASNFYDRSNYLDAFGNVVELTPIQLGWNFDLTY